MKTFSLKRLAYVEDLDKDPAVEKVVAGAGWRELAPGKYEAENWATPENRGSLIGIDKKHGFVVLRKGDSYVAWRNDDLDMIFFYDKDFDLGSTIKGPSDIGKILKWLESHHESKSHEDRVETREIYESV